MDPLCQNNKSINVGAEIGLHDDELDLDVVTSRPGIRTDLVCLFDELFCLCFVDTRNMDVKLDRQCKARQRITLPIRVVRGRFVYLTERNMPRYLDFTELFVLLVGHKTNRPGETCGVAGGKQLLGI